MSDFLIVASAFIEQDAGPIMGAIITVLSAIMNVIMNGVSLLFTRNSLGVTIILMTLVIRILMLPQGIQAIKSSQKMRAVQPEVEKIKKKYGGSKDPETVRKMNAETQEVYRKNKINPLGSCLPLLITMPIFIALIDLMRRLPWFITRVSDLYYSISYTILSVPDIIQARTNAYSVEGFVIGQNPGSPLFELMLGKTNEAIRADFLARNDEVLNVSRPEHFSRFIDSFFPYEWEQIKELVSVEPEIYDSLIPLLDQRDSIQTFFGINLVTAVNAGGIFTPAIVIPILSGGTSFLLSWVSMKMNPAGDQSQRMQRIMMMVAMPLMMFFFTFGISGGVGVYWIAGNVIAIVQQVLLMKFYVNRKPKVTVENQ